MKALLMLDHVMLWLARVFTALTAGILALPLILAALCSVLNVFLLLSQQCLLMSSPHLRTVFNAQEHSAGHSLLNFMSDPEQLLALTYTLLWFVSVRLLPSNTARIFLGLSSGFFAIIAASLFACLFILTFTSAGGWALAVFLSIFFLGFIGFTSMVWISIRLPRNTPPSFNQSGSHPLPQSS